MQGAVSLCSFSLLLNFRVDCFGVVSLLSFPSIISAFSPFYKKIFPCFVYFPHFPGKISVFAIQMQENYFPNARIDWFGCGIGIVMFYLILKRNWSVPKVITLAAVLGMVGYGVLGMA